MYKKIKIVSTFLLCAIGLTVLSFNSPVSATCTGYEVFDINTTGEKFSIGCFTDFNQAKSKMLEFNYGVMTHPASKSPEKIIAMTNGIVQSYPYRYMSGEKNAVTMTITQYASSTANEKTTYVGAHYEMTYFDTVSFDPATGNGRVNIGLTGFNGYVDLHQVDLIPMVYIDNGLSLMLGGSTPNGYEDPYKMNAPKHSKYTVNNDEVHYVSYSQYCDIKSANCTPNVKVSATIGKKADWMVNGQTYYSWDLENFYSDSNYQTHVGVYYNYYQHLPLRSKTNVTGAQMDQYLASLNKSNSIMANKGQVFIDAQNLYGTNALLVYAMAAHESGWGTSRIALEKNNLFGWNATDSNPGSDASIFPSVDACISDHMGVNLRGYLDVNDFRFFGSHLGNKGSGFNVKYASDPFWGLKIASTAYQIDKLSNFVDYNAYQIGIIEEYNTAIKSAASTSSSTLFNTAYGATYQKNYTAIILEDTNGWTKIQSTNGIRQDGSLVKHKENSVIMPKESYLYDISVGYVQTQKINVLNGEKNTEGTVPTEDFTSSIDRFEWVDTNLLITGHAYRPGIYVNDLNKITHTLVFENEENIKTEFDLSTMMVDQQQAQFSLSEVNVSSLENGVYKIMIDTKYSELSEFNNQLYINDIPASLQTKKFDGRQYEFTIKDGFVVLSISNIVSDLESSLRQGLDKFEYVKDNTILIEGFAFISGMNASDNDVIKHEIILSNTDTNTQEVYPALTSDYDIINLYDGFTYKKIKYSVEIDLNDLVAGNYVVELQVTNKEEVFKSTLKSIYSTLVPANNTINDNLVRIFQNQFYNYRYEISIEKTSFDYSLVNKPTMRNSSFGIDKLTFENNVLNFEALGWIYNENFTDETIVERNIVLLNENGEQFTYPTTSKSCTLDYTTLLNSSFDLDKICFDASVDLSGLQTGSYRMYLEVKTTNYYDIYELTDLYSKVPSASIYENKKYELLITDTRYRIILNITDEVIEP